MIRAHWVKVNSVKHAELQTNEFAFPGSFYVAAVQIEGKYDKLCLGQIPSIVWFQLNS
jgi:hypothetical protein